MMLLERVIPRAEDGHPLRAKQGDDVVLGGTVVARRDHFGTARLQHFEQHRGLRFEVQRHADASAGEAAVAR